MKTRCPYNKRLPCDGSIFSCLQCEKEETARVERFTRLLISIGLILVVILIIQGCTGQRKQYGVVYDYQVSGMRYKVFDSRDGLFVVNVTRDSLECVRLSWHPSIYIGGPTIEPPIEVPSSFFTNCLFADSIQTLYYDSIR